MMLIVFYDQRTRKTRNVFVYAESGKEIMHWFCAIRTAKIKLLQETFPERPLEVVSSFLVSISRHCSIVCELWQIGKKASRDFLCYGYLEKTPPQQNVRRNTLSIDLFSLCRNGRNVSLFSTKTR